jgi:drug/metabolite transporter (DMT)-like permease
MNACAKASNAFHGPVEMVFLRGVVALRNLGRTEDSLTTVFYFLLGGVLLSAPYTLAAGSLPAGETLLWVAGIGLFAAVQQLAKTAAYRFAEASFLAPYTYTAIVWATLAGWMPWRETLTIPVMAGAVVVIASNLFILRQSDSRQS